MKNILIFGISLTFLFYSSDTFGTEKSRVTSEQEIEIKLLNSELILYNGLELGYEEFKFRFGQNIMNHAQERSLQTLKIKLLNEPKVSYKFYIKIYSLILKYTEAFELRIRTENLQLLEEGKANYLEDLRQLPVIEILGY